METKVDEVEGKASVFSQENPMYDSNMKLYQTDRYDFQHSGETPLLHKIIPYSSLTFMTAEMTEFLLV